MPSQEFMHFPAGETHFGGSPDNSTDGGNILGEEIQTRDRWHGTGRLRTWRIVRNSSGIALEPKRLVLLNADGTEIIGYANAPSDKAFPIDDQLSSSTTVATNDICLVGVKGPHVCLTDLANYAADVAAGDYLTPQTAATSQATTAGRVVLQAITSNVTAMQTLARGVFGRAISTALTSDTNSDLLVDVGGQDV